jgi:cysteine desulfurase
MGKNEAVSVIYLDYSANTPADRAVLEAFCKTEQTFWGNPNSTHPLGRLAGQAMADATAHIAALLGVQPQEVIFTSGASESNNLAIKGIAQASRPLGRHILSTALEHSSVGGALSALQQQGWEIDLLDIDRNGQVDLQQLEELLRPDTVLVAVSAVDSELGTVQPIQAIGALVKRYPNCHLHVDATQAVGKTPLVWEGVDTMSIAPHKFYGLNGSGLLVKRQNVVLEPLIHGGVSTTIYRSGTPALGLAVSTEVALTKALENRSQWASYVAELNHKLRKALSAYPQVVINSPEGAVPHILNLSVEGVKGTVFQEALAQRGVCVSVKSACSTPGTPSKAVFAVSRNRKRAMSSWRISLSHLTTPEELEEFLKIFDACYKELLP